MIGFQKTQIYQRFAGSRQEVFILNCARNNINFCNYIPQTIITKHIFKSIVSRIAYFFCLRSVCLINRYFIIGSIADNSVSDVVPNKLNFCSPVQTALEFADGFKIHAAVWDDNIVVHRECPHILLKLRCATGVIDRWPRHGMFIRRIPIDFVIMGIRMFISAVVICFMPLDFRTTITSDFCSEYLVVAHYGRFNFSGFTPVTLILWLIRVWPPFPAIRAAAALISAADQVWLYCITFRSICLADFESVEIF